MVALDERSISRAARHLAVGQPPMSRSLKRLRELLGDPVLERRGSTMVATERARKIARRVREGLDTIDAALHADASSVPGDADEVFRVGMSDDLASTLRASPFEQLQLDAPRCRLLIISSEAGPVRPPSGSAMTAMEGRGAGGRPGVEAPSAGARAIGNVRGGLEARVSGREDARVPSDAEVETEKSSNLYRRAVGFRWVFISPIAPRASAP
jgi:hypothetical protein